MKCFVLSKNALPIDQANQMVVSLRSAGNDAHSVCPLASDYYLVMLHDARGEEFSRVLFAKRIDVSVLHGDDDRESIKVLLDRAMKSTAALVRAKTMSGLVDSIVGGAGRPSLARSSTSMLG